MTFNQTPASSTKVFVNHESFHFRPKRDADPYAEEPDAFTDCQIDAIVEEIEMRSARSFDHAVEAGSISTRRPKCSRSTHDIPRAPWRRRRYPRPMPSLLLAILAIFGLLVALFISNGHPRPIPSLEIKTTTSSTITNPTIEQPPPPTRYSPIRPVKMPRKPQLPAMLTSTDPTPIPTTPLTIP